MAIARRPRNLRPFSCWPLGGDSTFKYGQLMLDRYVVSMRLVHAPVAAAPWSFWPLMALPKRLGKIVVENGYSLASYYYYYYYYYVLPVGMSYLGMHCYNSSKLRY